MVSNFRPLDLIFENKITSEIFCTLPMLIARCKNCSQVFNLYQYEDFNSYVMVLNFRHRVLCVCENKSTCNDFLYIACW